MNDIYVTVTGWVAKTPDLRVTKDDSQWTTLRIGSTPRRRNADGDWVDGVTQWFDVKIWGRSARNVATSVRGGQPVIVSGRMFTEEWETPEGTRSTQVIHATSIGHDLTRGKADFVRVKYESGPEDADDGVAAQGFPGTEPAGATTGADSSVGEPEPVF